MPPTIKIPQESFLVNHLFDDSSFFLKEAMKNDGTDKLMARTYVRASIITGFAALEAFANTSLYLLDETDDLALHERAFAQEKRVELAEEGHFEIRGKQFRSLEEKIHFLYWRRAGVPIPKSNAAWSFFLNATKLRNKLVHPKPGHVSYSGLTVSAAKASLVANIKVAQLLGWGQHNF